MLGRAREILEREGLWLIPLGTVVSIVAVIVSLAGWIWTALQKRKFQTENESLDQRAHELHLERTRFDVRLDHVDPERFLDKLQELAGNGEFDAAENLAENFFQKQHEAIGRAAEYLAEQNILASDEDGVAAAREAQRFATLARAAFPDSNRIDELEDLAMRRKTAAERGEPIETLNWDGLTDVELNSLSQSLIKDGKYVLAELAARRSVPLALLRNGERSRSYSGALGHHAFTLGKMGAYREAEAIHKKALEIDRATIGEEHPDYAISLNNLALVVQAQGRSAEAQVLYCQALEIDRATNGEEHLAYAIRLNNLASVVQAQGRYAEAEDLYRQALEIDRARIGEGHPIYASHLSNLAGTVLAQGRFEEAEELHREVLEITRATIGKGHPGYAICLNNLASAVEAQGRSAEAEELFREALKIDRATIGERHPDYATRLINLGSVLGGQGRVAEAREMLAQAMAIFHDTLPADHSHIAETQRRIEALPPAAE